MTGRSSMMLPKAPNQQPYVTRTDVPRVSSGFWNSFKLTPGEIELRYRQSQRLTSHLHTSILEPTRSAPSDFSDKPRDFLLSKSPRRYLYDTNTACSEPSKDSDDDPDKMMITYVDYILQEHHLMNVLKNHLHSHKKNQKHLFILIMIHKSYLDRVQ